MNGRRRSWLIPLTLMAIGLSFGLTAYPLLDPDEGRNAEVAREMAATNNYILPHLNELPYVDKPVLFFGVAALSMEIFGPTVLAARLTPLFFTLLTVVLVWWIGRRLYGSTGGIIAAVAVGTMPLTIAFARTVIFDSALTFFVTAALMSFFIAIDADDSAEGRTVAQRWVPAAFGCIALGVLTKGPIAFVIPFLVVVPFAVWRKRVRRLFDPLAWLLLLAIVLPWVAAVSRSVPDFVRYVVYTESIGRLLTTELQRTGPIWYFFPIVTAGSLPWSLVVLFGVRKLTLDRRVVFLSLWILLPLLFFSLSQSKRPQYVVPLLPPIALLVAHLWHKTSGRLPAARATAIALVPIALVLGAAPVIVQQLLDVSPAIAAAIPGTAVTLAVATLIAAAGIWLWSTRVVVAAAFLSIPAAAIAIGSPKLMRAIGEDRSAYLAALTIEPYLNESTEIVAIDVYPLSLPFYLRRTFTLSTTNGSELTSNYLMQAIDRYRGVLGSPVRPAEWWLDALVNCSRPTIFLAAKDDRSSRSVLEDRLPLIAEMKRAVAYGPCQSSVLATPPHADGANGSRSTLTDDAEPRHDYRRRSHNHRSAI